MISLPPWIDREAWDGFQEMRKKIKKPMTDRAIKMLLKRLDEMHSKGHDVNACLDQSTFHSWQDCYPLQDKAVPTVQSTAYEETQQRMKQEAERKCGPPPEQVRAKIADITKHMRRTA